jgi:hypothetical protein
MFLKLNPSIFAMLAHGKSKSNPIICLFILLASWMQERVAA